MSPLPVVATEQQKAAEASLLFRLEGKRRQNLERRFNKALTKSQEKAIIDALPKNFREKMESRFLGGVSKNRVFISVMSYWYLAMSPDKKRQLTDRQLKKRALAVCKEHNIEYLKLPLDWISQLAIRVGLKYQRTTTGPTNAKAVASKTPKKIA